MALPGIEPGSRASEALILSIVLQSLCGYFISPPTLLLKIFTAMASKITPKNLRTAINPAFPGTFFYMEQELYYKNEDHYVIEYACRDLLRGVTNF